MAAAAAQQAPKKQAPQKNGANKQTGGNPAGKKTGKSAFRDLPLAAGIAVMALAIILALPVGNFRALQKASPKDFIRWGDVESIIEDRIDAGENILSVAGRVGLDANAVNAAESAVKELEKAKGARAISRADQALTAAMAELTTADLAGEDARSMRSAADAFAEQGSFLRQEARAYNEKAEKAGKLYEKLPMKFMLSEPDVYEGI